jgi:glucuronoarabinoxylan endo-1,4-beta-xylanase
MTLSKRTFLKAMAAAPLAAGTAHAADQTINWDSLEQTMDGFGASASFHQALVLQQFPEPQRSQILDLLFSTEKGAGLSIVRNDVGEGGHWGKPMNGPTPSIEPEPGDWRWKGDEDQIWFMREAKKRGCPRNLSTVWSPPAWMKTNNDVTNGGAVKPECYRQYAEYLSAYVRGYKRHHGIDIYAISPTNEPDINAKYSSCLWTGEQLLVLVRDHIAPVFARDKVKAKFLLGECSHWREDPYAPSLADPVARARVDIAASHAYTSVNRGYEDIALRVGPMKAARAAGKPLWQTEVSSFDNLPGDMKDALYWARLLHTHVVENQVSAWLYWWALHDANNRGALIPVDPANGTFVAAKRLFAMGQWSRFVRPGFKRVTTVSSPLSGVWLSAFRDPHSARRVVVAVNENDEEQMIQFPAPGGTGALYRTSATEDLVLVSELGAEGGLFVAPLAPQSITSVVLA